MKSFNEIQKKLDVLFSHIDCDFVCNICVGSRLQDSLLFEFDKLKNSIDLVSNGEKYCIGKINGKKVIIDPKMCWSDLRILDTNDKEILNLSNCDFTTMDLI